MFYFNHFLFFFSWQYTQLSHISPDWSQQDPKGLASFVPIPGLDPSTGTGHLLSNSNRFTRLRFTRAITGRQNVCFHSLKNNDAVRMIPASDIWETKFEPWWVRPDNLSITSVMMELLFPSLMENAPNEHLGYPRPPFKSTAEPLGLLTAKWNRPMAAPIGLVFTTWFAPHVTH